MKPVVMFMMESCPHCKRARKWMDELTSENPVYKNLKIQMIDETKDPEVADKFDYYLVPTYYVDGEKVHEGVASRDIIKQVFDTAL